MLSKTFCITALLALVQVQAIHLPGKGIDGVDAFNTPKELRERDGSGKRALGVSKDGSRKFAEAVKRGQEVSFDSDLPITCMIVDCLDMAYFERACYEWNNTAACRQMCGPVGYDAMGYCFNCILANGGASPTLDPPSSKNSNITYDWSSDDLTARLARLPDTCDKLWASAKSSIKVTATSTVAGVYTTTFDPKGSATPTAWAEFKDYEDQNDPDQWFFNRPSVLSSLMATASMSATPSMSNSPSASAPPSGAPTSASQSAVISSASGEAASSAPTPSSASASSSSAAAARKRRMDG